MSTTRSIAASARPSRVRTAEQGGTGLVGTLFGATAFLLLLLFATQILLGLYTTTVVSSASLDASVELSHRIDPTDIAAQQLAADGARRRLGSFGRDPGRVTFDWTGTDGDEVVLTVHARKMTLLPAAFGDALGNRIDRTFRTRVERVR
jgi:hypothetical protein